jgi:hypothetical protein
MHYSAGTRRIDEAAGLADIDKMIANLVAKIKRGDDERSTPGDSWESRKAALAWQYERPVLVDALVELRRKRQVTGPDNSYRPATGAVFYGADS